MTPDKEKLAANLKTAPIWVVFDQVFGRVLRIAVSIILARILIPDDFGIYAISLGLLELARLTGNLGIGTAIVQSNEDPQHFANAAFWLNMSASLFMFFSSFIFGIIGASFYGTPELKFAVPVLGLTFLSAGYIHINQSLLVRNLQFKTITQASVMRVIFEGSSSVVLAVFGFGFWAFILGFVIGDVVNSLVIFWLSKWRPTWKPNFKYPKIYLKFGLNIFLFSASTYLLEQLPNLIVGKVASIYVLGLFTFAFRQSKWVADVPKMAGKNFLLSALSRVQNIKSEFEKYYSLWIRFLLVWGMPIFAIQIALAPLYVAPVFGAKWIPAIQAMQIMILFMFLDVTFYEVHSESIIARAKVHLNVYWRIIEAVFIATALYFTAPMGVTAIAASMLLIRLVMLPVYMLTTSGRINLEIRSFLKSHVILILSSFVFCGLNYYFSLLIFEKAVSLAIVLYAALLLIWLAMGFRFLPETKKLFDILFSKLNFSKFQFNQSKV